MGGMVGIGNEQFEKETDEEYDEMCTVHLIEIYVQCIPELFCLDGSLVWDRGDSLWEVILDSDGTSLTGLGGLPLQVHMRPSSLSFPLLLSVRLDTVDELLSALGVLDVLNANVHTLLDVSVADELVEDDSEGGLGDVVDNTGLTVVDLVGHTIIEDVYQCLYPSKYKVPKIKLTPSEQHHWP